MRRTRLNPVFLWCRYMTHEKKAVCSLCGEERRAKRMFSMAISAHPLLFARQPDRDGGVDVGEKWKPKSGRFYVQMCWKCLSRMATKLDQFIEEHELPRKTNFRKSYEARKQHPESKKRVTAISV